MGNQKQHGLYVTNVDGKAQRLLLFRLYSIIVLLFKTTDFLFIHLVYFKECYWVNPLAASNEEAIHT